MPIKGGKKKPNKATRAAKAKKRADAAAKKAGNRLGTTMASGRPVRPADRAAAASRARARSNGTATKAAKKKR